MEKINPNDKFLRKNKEKHKPSNRNVQKFFKVEQKRKR